MMAHLVVTRPEPQASKTIEALRARGHNVTHIPLTALKPLPHSSVLPQNYSAIIATSSNALKFATDDLRDQISGKPIYCVGSKTAKKAIERGLAKSMDTITCCENTTQLAEIISGEIPHHYLYLCSKHRISTLDEILPSSRLHIIETYEAPYIEPKINISTPVDGVLLYSARAAKFWVKMGIQANFSFCMSEFVAQNLSDPHNHMVKIAAKPLEHHLFDEIDKIFPTN